MSDVIVAGILLGILIVAACGFISYKIEVLRKEVVKNQDVIYFQVEARMEQLMETAKKLENAIGNREGREELLIEQKAVDDPTKVVVVEPAEVIVVEKK